MGQHKYNPTAIAAKNGELPPKPPKPSKREQERAIYEALRIAMMERLTRAAKKVSESEENT